MEHSDNYTMDIGQDCWSKPWGTCLKVTATYTVPIAILLFLFHKFVGQSKKAYAF